MGHCWAFGLCFTGDALVQVTALAGGMCEDGTSGLTVAIAVDGDGGTATLLDKSLALAAHPRLLAIPITDVPLGARVLADNPRPEEFDTAFPEPDQATWVTLSLDLMKRDGTPVRAEFLRPREWVERNGIVAGAVLPIAISELEIEGDAFVTSITACPPVAEGSGRVVTGRFVTRDAGNLVQITLENGTEIRATDVHPIWSVDGEEWIPAGELVPGELVDTLTGPVAVESVERLHSGLDVYNIEVHGEHVFRVTADGVLVHNAYLSDAAGAAKTHVYLGIRNNAPVYVGITTDIARRQSEHSGRFILQGLTDLPLTRNQARAIEQVIKVRNPQFENVINSISPTRSWYGEAIEWGAKWLADNGYNL